MNLVEQLQSKLTFYAREEPLRRDYTVSTNDFGFSCGPGGIYVDGEWGSMFIERQAFVRLFSELIQKAQGDKPAYVARFLFDNQSVMCENTVEYLNRIVRADQKQFLFRAYDNNLRAVLTTNYTPINNFNVIAYTLQALKESDQLENARLIETQSRFNRDNMVIKFIVDDHQEGQYGSGMMIYNGEVGDVGLGFAPLVKRTSCDNSIVGERKFAVYHRGDTNTRLNNIKPFIVNAIGSGSPILQRLLYAKKSELLPSEQFEEMVKRQAVRYGFSESFVTSLYEGTEGKQNLYGLVNGITHAAKFEGENREQFEKIACDILFDEDIL